MPLTPIAIAFLSAAALLLVMSSVWSHLAQTRKQTSLKRRIEMAGGVSGVTRKADFLGDMSSSFWSFIIRLGQRLGPQDTETLSATRLRILQAGLRKPNAHLIFWGVKCFLALVLAAPVLFGGVVADLLGSTLSLAAVALSAAAIGFYAPEIWLSAKLSTRKKNALMELPDALDLLVVCVEAGMGLDQAINRVAQEMSNSARVISEELRLMTLEMRAGKPRHEAMRALSTRIGVEDVSNLVTLIIQSDMFGTSIAQTLRVYSDTLRTKRNQRAEEKAASLPIKLLFPLIFCIFPALFVVIMGPAVIKIFFSG
jgi:tight adherence protein C